VNPSGHRVASKVNPKVTDAVTRKVQKLAKLTDLKAAELTHERELRHTVIAARNSGASWMEIGRAMGVSDVAVWKRFSPNRPGVKRKPVAAVKGQGRLPV
jgi:hypothetical protein